MKMKLLLVLIDPIFIYLGLQQKDVLALYCSKKHTPLLLDNPATASLFLLSGIPFVNYQLFCVLSSYDQSPRLESSSFHYSTIKAQEHKNHGLYSDYLSAFEVA